MSLRWTSLDTIPTRYREQAEKQLQRSHKQRSVDSAHQGATAGRKSPTTQQGPKYGNQPTTDPETGSRIDSKREARRLAELRALRRAGDIVWLAKQVELQLTASRYMIVDFVYLCADGRLVWEDAKGAPPTADWRTKQALARDIHGIEVKTV